MKSNSIIKLKTFDTTTIKKKVSTKNCTVAVKADRQTFARLIAIQQRRDVDLKEVLTYELAAFPLSIANADGLLCKTVKSKLHSVLESSIPQVLSVPLNTVAIFDAMVLLRKLPPFSLKLLEIFKTTSYLRSQKKAEGQYFSLLFVLLYIYSVWQLSATIPKVFPNLKKYLRF